MDKLQKSIKVIGMGILIFLIHFLIFIRFFILGSLSLMVLMVLFVIQPDTTLYDISLIAKSEAFILLAGLFAMVMLGINLISKGGSTFNFREKSCSSYIYKRFRFGNSSSYY